MRDGFDNFYNQNPALLQVAQASRAPEVTMNFVSVGVEPVEEEEDDLLPRAKRARPEWRERAENEALEYTEDRGRRGRGGPTSLAE